MSIIKDGKSYYKREEAKNISRRIMENDAKEFAKEVIKRQKQIASQSNTYV